MFSISHIISKKERIDLAIISMHTYLNAKLICSFVTDKTVYLTYESGRFNLYEGEQWFSIQHPFSNIIAHGLYLKMKIVDQESVVVGECCRYLQDDSGKTPQPMIKVTGDIGRITEGGAITVEVAGIAYKLHTHYNDNLRQLEDYISTKEPVCDVCIAEDNIRKEKECLYRLYKYPPSEATMEMYALRNMVSDSLVDYNCFRIHGAAFAVDGKGYIFTADSGTGKTTHMRLWLKNLQNAYVVNGDQPIVKVGQGVMVCGSPWCGKEGLNTNTAVPLKAIIIMERSAENSIDEISMKEALIEIIRQVYKPLDASKMIKTLHLLSLLDGKIKFYRFKFNNFADDAFSVAYSKIHIGL